MSVDHGEPTMRQVRSAWPLVAAVCVVVLLGVVSGMWTASATEASERLRRGDVQRTTQSLAIMLQANLSTIGTTLTAMTPPAATFSATAEPGTYDTLLRKLSPADTDFDGGVALFRADGTWTGSASTPAAARPSPADPGYRAVFESLRDKAPAGFSDVMSTAAGSRFLAVGVPAGPAAVLVWHISLARLAADPLIAAFSQGQPGAAYYLLTRHGSVLASSKPQMAGQVLAEVRPRWLVRRTFQNIELLSQREVLITEPVEGFGLSVAFHQPVSDFYGGVAQKSRLSLLALELLLLLVLLGASYIGFRRHRTTRLHAERLYHQATHDGLTGLSNRSRFLDELEAALRRSRRTGASVALLYLDLDGFKQINDTMGHLAGDEVLRVTAERIRGCLRATDMVARLGGDEFTVLMEGVTPDFAIGVAERIVGTVGQPIKFDGREGQVTTSLGLIVAPAGPLTSADALLRDADLAMFEAKDAGKNTYRVYASSPDLSISRQRIGNAPVSLTPRG